MVEIPINTKINASQHPSAIRGESPGAKSARIALGNLYEAEGKIRSLHEVVKGKAIVHQQRIMASMPKPEGAKKKLAPALVYDEFAAAHVIATGQPIALKALDAADKTIVSLGEQVTRIDATIDLKITAGKNSNRGSEIRAWAAKQDSPFLVLGPLFQKANENQTLVAEVLLGEHFLSGISADNKAALRAVAANVLAGDEVQGRAEASAALDHLTASAQAFTTTTAGLFNELRSPTIGAIDHIVGDDQ